MQQLQADLDDLKTALCSCRQWQQGWEQAIKQTAWLQWDRLKNYLMTQDTHIGWQQTVLSWRRPDWHSFRYTAAIYLLSVRLPGAATIIVCDRCWHWLINIDRNSAAFDAVWLEKVITKLLLVWDCLLFYILFSCGHADLSCSLPTILSPDESCWPMANNHQRLSSLVFIVNFHLVHAWIIYS